MCWRRWHKWKREKRTFLTSTDGISADSSSSSLSRKLPLPPMNPWSLLPFRFTSSSAATAAVATYAVVHVIYACMLLLHSHVTWWNRRLDLSRSSFCLFLRVFRRCFFFPSRFCVCWTKKMRFRANIWVSKRLVHSLLIARKLIASICRNIVVGLEKKRFQAKFLGN